MLRLLSSLMLALMLGLTSQSMAVARGASAATGQMVLCMGTGPVAVYTDAQGQPTSAPHICPDAALHVLVDAGISVKGAAWRMVGVLSPTSKNAMAPRTQPRWAPPARAPPLTV